MVTRLPAQMLVLNAGLGDTETYAGTAFLKQLGAGAQEFQRNANRGDGIETADGILFLLAPEVRPFLAGARWVFRNGEAFLINSAGRIFATATEDLTASNLARITTAVADSEAGAMGFTMTNRVISAEGRQIQMKFKHAGDFNVSGSYNQSTASAFWEAIQQHVAAPGTQAISGTYRGSESVIHFLNPNTVLNVMTTNSGEFISGWALNPAQVRNVITRGRL